MLNHPTFVKLSLIIKTLILQSLQEHKNTLIVLPRNHKLKKTDAFSSILPQIYKIITQAI